MKIRNIEFWYEGLVKLNKKQVIALLEKHIKESQLAQEYEFTVNDYLEELYKNGECDIGIGYLSMITELYGCPEEFWDDKRIVLL